MPDGDVTLSAVYKSAASSGDNTGSNGTDTGKAPTTGDNKPADGSVNVVLVVVLTAAISDNPDRTCHVSHLRQEDKGSEELTDSLSCKGTYINKTHLIFSGCVLFISGQTVSPT